ncbi:MAG: 2-keto-4-pentenoate hydratase [Acidimicrobiia bacterium]|nr:2-keto-4-pentenoate hydratase [Acidimicrobiia bacterium]
MTEAALQSISDRLAAAYDGTAIAPVREELADGGIDAAYRVQQLTVDAWRAAGRRVVGRKIGLTSVVVQQQLGVDQPDYGALTADMSLVSGEPVPAGALIQPRVEAEVALVLGDDVDHADLTLAELTRAIDYLVPSIEIVDSRITGWDITILDTIADNASSAMYALGTRPVAPGDIELRDAEMTMTVNGETASTGTGAACLGHPYIAALWLARRMSELGTHLRAGDVVLTGALGPMVDLKPGDEVEAAIAGLGTVRTSWEASS